MDRINGADTVDIGGGNRGFKDENVVAGVIGTEVTAAHLNSLQEEILKVIEAAGIEPDSADWTQLWQALQLLTTVELPWAAALEFADVDDETHIATIKQIHSLFAANAVLQNNLVFPEVETADGRLAVTDNADGTLTIDAAQTWLHRGLFRYSSDVFILADRTVTTVASKTYHLRWHAPGTGTALPVETYPNGRLELADLTGASPAEDDAGYDTTYDQMLIARIVTDGANAATVTALSNMATLNALITGAARSYSGAAASDPNYPFTFNWSRLPRYSLGALLPPSNSYDSDYYIYPSVLNRYGSTIYSWSWHHGYPNQSPGFHINLEA